jgi:hypothetical protein
MSRKKTAGGDDDDLEEAVGPQLRRFQAGELHSLSFSFSFLLLQISKKFFFLKKNRVGAQCVMRIL